MSKQSDETRAGGRHRKGYRRGLGFALLLILVVVTWKDWPGMVLLTERENRTWMYERQFDSFDPDWAEALRFVEEHSTRGEKIVLVMGRGEQAAIDFRHRRAEWVLAGREIIPSIRPDPSSLRHVVTGSSFVITWRARVSIDGFEPVAAGPEVQVLARR